MPPEVTGNTPNVPPSTSASQALLDRPAGNESGSMDSTIRETLSKLRSSGTPEGEGANELAGGERPAGTGQPAPRTNSAGRVIGPDGKFVKAEGAEQPSATDPESGAEVTTEGEQPPAEEQAEGEQAGETTETPQATTKPHDVPPSTWKKEAAADWSKLPEPVRAEIHRREGDIMAGIRQYKSGYEFGGSIAHVLNPYAPTMRAAGLQPQEVVKRAVETWASIHTGTPDQKRATLLQVAKDYGINLAVAPGTETPQPQPGATQTPTQDDPRLAAALQRLDQLETTLTKAEQEKAEAEFAAEVENVRKFGADPKNKHFEAVREDMQRLIDTGVATSLQDAYDKAIWVNPTVRPLLLAEQEQERIRKEAAAAAAARKASGANVTRRGTPPVPPKPTTMEDTIRNKLHELTGGG